MARAFKYILAFAALAMPAPILAQSITPPPFPAGAGTVTSAGVGSISGVTTSGAPVTTTGVVTQTLNTQTANTVFAAPNGSAGAPAFRMLNATDMGALLSSSNTWTNNNAFNAQLSSQQFNASLQNYPSVSGSYWYTQGHPNWNIVQTSVNYNPTEFQVYAAGGQGKAHCDNPGVTGVVDLDSGTSFTSAWVGIGGFYLTAVNALHGAYTVASVGSSTQLTLSATCVGSGSQTFHFVTTTNTGTVNVSGTSVTYVSGMPFDVFATGIGQWTINGSVFTCSAITLTTATCNTSGTLTGVTYSSWFNVNDEVATFRLQKVLGANEENLTCTARAIGLYDCRPLYAGSGTLWPTVWGNGNYSYDSSLYNQVAIEPTGELLLGGVYNRNSLIIPAISGQYSVNYVAVAGGASTTGAPNPAIEARACGACTETSVSLGYDALGSGNHTFTSHSFGNIEFQIYGNGQGNYLALGSSATSPAIVAAGSSTNIGINFTPKGSGTVYVGGPLVLPSSTVASLPACNASTTNALYAATDVLTATFNATPTGGGTIHIPVFCNGSNWTIQ